MFEDALEEEYQLYQAAHLQVFGKMIIDQEGAKELVTPDQGCEDNKFVQEIRRRREDFGEVTSEERHKKIAEKLSSLANLPSIKRVKKLYKLSMGMIPGEVVSFRLRANLETEEQTLLFTYKFNPTKDQPLNFRFTRGGGYGKSYNSLAFLLASQKIYEYSPAQDLKKQIVCYDAQLEPQHNYEQKEIEAPLFNLYKKYNKLYPIPSDSESEYKILICTLTFLFDGEIARRLSHSISDCGENNYHDLPVSLGIKMALEIAEKDPDFLEEFLRPSRNYHIFSDDSGEVRKLNFKNLIRAYWEKCGKMSMRARMRFIEPKITGIQEQFQHTINAYSALIEEFKAKMTIIPGSTSNPAIAPSSQREDLDMRIKGNLLTIDQSSRIIESSFGIIKLQTEQVRQACISEVYVNEYINELAGQIREFFNPRSLQNAAASSSSAFLQGGAGASSSGTFDAEGGGSQEAESDTVSISSTSTAGGSSTDEAQEASSL